MATKKTHLPETSIPKAWYNLVADLDTPPAPPLHPATRLPVGPDDLAAVLPMELIKQEGSRERFLEIPDDVRDIYRIWRPTPLVRARRLEKALDTPARIYFKNEGVSPSGSHKSNTAIAQAYYAKKGGLKALTTETGAGQWGSALALGCKVFGLDLQVFMVKVSFEQKPYRKIMMKLYGAEVAASPSTLTQVGRTIVAEDPDSPGSLAIAIAEAMEMAAGRPDTRYTLGSVLNHVLLHQTVIGEECLEQFDLVDDYPDLIIGCVGGGSSFAGMAFPFLREKLQGKGNPRFVAVEPSACPTLTQGVFTYDFGDVAGSTPLLKMHTLGHSFVPPGIHAGGLRFHGMAPLVSHVFDLGLISAVAVPQLACFQAAALFAAAEGIVPAPESSHAIRVAVDEALRSREEGVPRTILFNLTGHGLLDLSSYDSFLAGELVDHLGNATELRAAIEGLPVAV